MRAGYIDFGDAMSFDTTHKTNIHERTLAMFVGSNHHVQNTLFGCALLGDEIVSGCSKHAKSAWGIRTRCILIGDMFIMDVVLIHVCVLLSMKLTLMYLHRILLRIKTR
jgi:hypothetical protein